MTTIYTTQRCLTVEEDYYFISEALIFPNSELLELTEVMTHYSEFNNKTTVNKRKVLIQKQYIVEVIGDNCETTS